MLLHVCLAASKGSGQRGGRIVLQIILLDVFAFRYLGHNKINYFESGSLDNLTMLEEL